MSNESTNIIETMSAELEHLRPMEASLEMAEADVKAYKQRIAVLEKEVGRLQRYHDAEATKWLAENQKLKSEADKVIAEKDAEIVELKKQVHDYALGLFVIQAKAGKELLHSNYKRCLDMASFCQYRSEVFFTWSKKRAFLLKWQNRWMKLAEKFNEAQTPGGLIWH